MPPPTVMLMMPAARPKVPTARTKDSRGAAAEGIGQNVIVFFA